MYYSPNDFHPQFRILDEKSQAEKVKEISNTINSLDLVQYPNLQKDYLRTKETRFALLRKIINDSYSNPRWTVTQIINSIENITD